MDDLARERLAHHVVDRLITPFVVVSRDGTVRFWNQSAETVFGYRRTEAEGRHLEGLIVPPERRAEREAALAAAAASGSSMQLTEFRDKDGETVTLVVAVDAVMDHGGPSEYYVLTPRKTDVLRPLTGRPAAAQLEGLTARQREVLELIADGWSTRNIAQKLKLSVKTVETHRAHLMQRLRVDSVARLVRYAVAVGLVPATP